MIALLDPDNSLLRFSLFEIIYNQGNKTLFIQDKCCHVTLCLHLMEPNYREGPVSRTLWIEDSMERKRARGSLELNGDSNSHLNHQPLPLSNDRVVCFHIIRKSTQIVHNDKFSPLVPSYYPPVRLVQFRYQFTAVSCSIQKPACSRKGSLTNLIQISNDPLSQPSPF